MLVKFLDFTSGDEVDILVKTFDKNVAGVRHRNQLLGEGNVGTSREAIRWSMGTDRARRTRGMGQSDREGTEGRTAHAHPDCASWRA